MRHKFLIVNTLGIILISSSNKFTQSVGSSADASTALILNFCKCYYYYRGLIIQKKTIPFMHA